MICKTALDAISLAIGVEESFHQQALGDERLEPVSSNHLMETDGYLWLPGIDLGKRVPYLSYAQVRDAVNKSDEELKAVEPILTALVDTSSHRHPKLAQRWATALDWFGEGNREKSDAVALAKIGTSLDVLSNGGKCGGILEMITNLTGFSSDKEVISGRRPKKLYQVVKDIYDNGRSKILHGTHYDRLLPFAEDRHRAACLTRKALLESAMRLKTYSGDDIDTAFRMMPRT